MTSIDTTINGEPYTISCPTPPADWSPSRSDDAVPSDIGIPAPERAAPKHRLSASQFRDKLAETAETPQLRREPGPGDIDIDPPCVEPALEHIESTTIGTIFHKLCEFEPERTEWPAIIRRLVEDSEEVSEAAIDDIIRQTEAGLEAVRQLESESLVHSRHNELGATLDLEAATVVGDIDYLSTTDYGYVMSDFKTSTVDETTIADRTEHYSSAVAPLRRRADAGRFAG